MSNRTQAFFAQAQTLQVSPGHAGDRPAPSFCQRWLKHIGLGKTLAAFALTGMAALAPQIGQQRDAWVALDDAAATVQQYNQAHGLADAGISLNLTRASPAAAATDTVAAFADMMTGVDMDQSGHGNGVAHAGISSDKTDLTCRVTISPDGYTDQVHLFQLQDTGYSFQLSKLGVSLDEQRQITLLHELSHCHQGVLLKQGAPLFQDQRLTDQQNNLMNLALHYAAPSMSSQMRESFADSRAMLIYGQQHPERYTAIIDAISTLRDARQRTDPGHWTSPALKTLRGVDPASLDAAGIDRVAMQAASAGLLAGMDQTRTRHGVSRLADLPRYIAPMTKLLADSAQREFASTPQEQARLHDTLQGSPFGAEAIQARAAGVSAQSFAEQWMRNSIGDPAAVAQSIHARVSQADTNTPIVSADKLANWRASHGASHSSPRPG